MHVGDRVGQDLGLLERRGPALGRLLDPAAHGLLEGHELGVHVGAVPLLDDVVRGPLGGVAAGRGRRARAGLRVPGETAGHLAVGGGRGGRSGLRRADGSRVLLGCDFGTGRPARIRGRDDLAGFLSVGPAAGGRSRRGDGLGKVGGRDVGGGPGLIITFEVLCGVLAEVPDVSEVDQEI